MILFQNTGTDGLVHVLTVRNTDHANNNYCLPGRETNRLLCCLDGKHSIMKNIILIRSRLVLLTLLSVFPLFITSGCKKTSDVPGPNEVFIEGNTFRPSTITVTAGTTITWTNKDGVIHTVTSTTGLFDSGSISSNGIYSHTFTTAGTFPYYCTVHPFMTATVIVN